MAAWLAQHPLAAHMGSIMSAHTRTTSAHQDTPPNGSWLQGRITGDHLRSSGFPPPSAEKLSLLVCGPVAMHEHLVGVLKSTGYDESACKFFE